MKPVIGLALGGGGARGLAHLGVLKVLEEENIPIGCIAGTSMGAIIGAMYAQNPNANLVIEKFKLFLKSQDYESLGLKYIVPKTDQSLSFLQQTAHIIAKRVVINIAQSRTAILKSERLSKAIFFLIEKRNIQDTKIPFGAVVTDLHSGEGKFLQNGDIRNAVIISSSIPGFIPPKPSDGQLLTDGGVSDPVPVKHTHEMGADLVIGVSTASTKLLPLKAPNVIDIITRTEEIRGYHLSKALLEKADVYLHPDVKNAHWSEFLRFEEFIESGIEEARNKMPEIRRAINKKKGFLRQIFSK